MYKRAINYNTFSWVDESYTRKLYTFPSTICCLYLGKDKRGGNFAVRGMDKDLSLPFLSKWKDQIRKIKFEEKKSRKLANVAKDTK